MLPPQDLSSRNSMTDAVRYAVLISRVLPQASFFAAVMTALQTLFLFLKMHNYAEKRKKTMTWFIVFFILKLYGILISLFSISSNNCLLLLTQKPFLSKEISRSAERDQRLCLWKPRVSPAGSVGASASQRCPLDTSRPYIRKAAPNETSPDGIRVQVACSLPNETTKFLGE